MEWGIRPIGRAVAIGCSIGVLSFAAFAEQLTVIVEKGPSQDDPTNDACIAFTVAFSEPVTDFTALDVELSGTAGASVIEVQSAPPWDGATYTLKVSGMGQDGTVIVAVRAATCRALSDGGWNLASTSEDNDVLFDTTAPGEPDDRSPPDGASLATTHPIFSWSASEDPGGSGVKNYRITVTGPLHRDYYTGNTSYAPTLREGAYLWRVIARDHAGNSGGGGWHLLILDTTPPVFADLPANLVVDAELGRRSARVSWAEPTATDALSAVLPLAASCSPGERFRAGTTTVTYAAVDAAGNESFASFDVTVRVPQIDVIPEAEAGFLERDSEGPDGVEPSGELPISAAYGIGELIRGGFTLVAATGEPLTRAAVILVLYGVEVGTAFDVRTPLDVRVLRCGRREDVYRFAVETSDLLPGLYDLRFGFPDGSVLWMRVLLDLGEA